MLDCPPWLHPLFDVSISDDLRALEATARDVRFGVSFRDELTDDSRAAPQPAPAPARRSARHARAPKPVVVIAPSRRPNPYRELWDWPFDNDVLEFGLCEYTYRAAD